MNHDTIQAMAPQVEYPTWMYYFGLFALAYALVAGVVVTVREVRDGRLQRAIQQKCHNTSMRAVDARAAIRAVATDPQTRARSIAASMIVFAAVALICLVLIGLIAHFGPPPQPLPA